MTRWYELSEPEKKDRYRSISQHTRIRRGLQGEPGPSIHDSRPERWTRIGLTPPNCTSGRAGRFARDPDVCPECGEDYHRIWSGQNGVTAYDHRPYGMAGGRICRVEENDG